MVGKLFHGMPVKNVAGLTDIDKKSLHIIICNGYYREIGKQLMAMGIEQYYVWVDDNGALFSLVSDRESVGITAYAYRILGVVVTAQIMDVALLKQLEHAKEQCDYLLAFVSRENEAMIQILQNIKFINRVIGVEVVSNIDGKKFYCEKIINGGQA